MQCDNDEVRFGSHCFQNIQPDDRRIDPVDNGRLEYIVAMKGYMELDDYQAVLNKYDFKDLNAVPHTKVDQDYILGLMARMAEKIGG